MLLNMIEIGYVHCVERFVRYLKTPHFFLHDQHNRSTYLRIPVNVATQTAGKLPPKPVKAATLGGVVGA